MSCCRQNRGPGRGRGLPGRYKWKHRGPEIQNKFSLIDWRGMRNNLVRSVRFQWFRVKHPWISHRQLQILNNFPKIQVTSHEVAQQIIWLCFSWFWLWCQWPVLLWMSVSKKPLKYMLSLGNVAETNWTKGICMKNLARKCSHSFSSPLVPLGMCQMELAKVIIVM